MKKICSFAGHSRLYNSPVQAKIKEKVIELIEDYGVTEFWAGNYGDFDRYAAAAVRSVKEIYPDIKLILVLPYLTNEINKNRQHYYKNYDLLLMADIPENTPEKLKILKANEYMISRSDFLICYVTADRGGAAKTLEYTRKKKHITVFNLAD